jgi:hypothetical protein
VFEAAGDTIPAGRCRRKTVEIWDLLGNQVLYLEESPTPNRGLIWNSLDNEGRVVPDGLYYTEQLCREPTAGPHLYAHYHVVSP